MRWFWFFCLVLLITSCNQKKSDVELFQEGPVRISLTADPTRGYDPLLVNFSAYLETETGTFAEEIAEIKWIIRGPSGIDQEILQQSVNYQNEEDNREDFFYLEHFFRMPGNYRVSLVLNNGQYRSRGVPIKVLARP